VFKKRIFFIFVFLAAVSAIIWFPFVAYGGNLTLISVSPRDRSCVELFWGSAPHPSLSLSKGWNFISFPRLPSEQTPIETAFRDVSPNVGIIWGYDNLNKVWLKYRPSSPSSLDAVEFGKGYWVYMNSPGSISFYCWYYPKKMPPIKAYEGWNLIGYHATDDTPTSVAMDRIRDKWKAVWNWSDGQWYFKHADIPTDSFRELTVFKQASAYWIKVSKSIDICSAVFQFPCFDAGSASLQGSVAYNNGIDTLTVTMNDVKFRANISDGPPVFWISSDVSFKYTDTGGPPPKTTLTLTQTSGKPVNVTFTLEELKSFILEGQLIYKELSATLGDGSAPLGIDGYDAAISFSGIVIGLYDAKSDTFAGVAGGEAK
jgi:hypothetical protein